VPQITAKPTNIQPSPNSFLAASLNQLQWLLKYPSAVKQEGNRSKGRFKQNWRQSQVEKSEVRGQVMKGKQDRTVLSLVLNDISKHTQNAEYQAENSKDIRLHQVQGPTPQNSIIRWINLSGSYREYPAK